MIYFIDNKDIPYELIYYNSKKIINDKLNDDKYIKWLKLLYQKEG